jgi:hypothetical protein
MKNIKTIEEFLNEALRDNWRETVEDKDEFFGVEYSEQLGDKLIDHVHKYILNSDTDTSDDFAYEYMDANYDEDEYETIEDFWEDEHKKWFEGEFVRGKVEDVLEEFTYHLYLNFIHNGNDDILIHRLIDVNQVWLDLFLNKEKDEVHLGEFWAWGKDGADTYYGNGRKHKVLFLAKVKGVDINWKETFVANFRRPEEKEINLYDSTPLELVSITIDGKKVDLSNFKNKEIYA